MLGNCQMRALSSALRLLLPEAEISFTTFWQAGRRHEGARQVAARLGTPDFVVSSRFGGRFRDGTGFEELKAETGAVEVPVLLFAAFHPDLVYIFEKPGELSLLRGPVGDYHSALAAFGFLEGLSPAQTGRLFDAAVYRRLGYLDLWDPSAKGLLEAGRLAGWDLGADLMRWARRGAFMHSVNHQKTYVTADLARGVAARLGLAAAEADLDAVLADELLPQGSWPVYPPVAERYGVPGSAVFLAGGRGGPRSLGLDVFLEASFAAYHRFRLERFHCARVAAWRADAVLREELLAKALG